MLKLRELTSRVRKSKDAKTLTGNFIALACLQVAGYFFPLITLPYLTRVVGVENFGKIAFALAIIVYFQTLVDYGFILSAVRDIARCRDDKEKVSDIYSVVMWSRFTLTLVAFLLLCILILLIPKFYDMRVVLLMTFLLVPGHAMFPTWMFQAFERMKYITIFNLLVRTIFTVAVFIFIKQKDDYVLQPLLNAIGLLIAGIGSMALIRKWGIRFYGPKPREIVKAIKKNTDLFINQLVPNLYNSLSVIILGFTHGQTANGIYDGGNRFNELASHVMMALSRTFFPFLSRKIDKHDVYVKINLGVSACIAIFMVVAAPLIIHIFYNDEFHNSMYVLQILGISIFFLAVNNVYGTNYLIVKGYEKEIRQITVWCSVVGFIVAIPLVYFFSYIGAAIVIAFTRGLLATMVYRKARKIKKGLA